MFSNLVTEQERQNHLLINTKYTKLIDFEKNLVFIKEITSSNRIRSRYDVQGYYLPLIEFEYIANRLSKLNEEPASLIIEIDGEEEYIPNLGKSRFAKRRFAHNILTFRQIDPYGNAKCRW